MEDNEEWKSPKYKNWVRGVKGLKHLQDGLKKFVGNKVVIQRDQVLESVKTSLRLGSAVTCNSCTSDNLLPEHSVRNNPCTRDTCIQGNSRNCFGSKPRGRRACPYGICSKLYDAIVDAHTFRDPLWRNTDPSTWCSDPEGWSYAKCFQTTLNAGTSSSATDASGLLSIILNNSGFQSDINCILTSYPNAFESARNIRNDLLHCPKMELEEADLHKYLATFIAILKDQKCLLKDQEAIQSVEKLEKLQNNQITISLNEEINLIQVRKDALTVLNQLAKERKEIKEARLNMESNKRKILTETQEAGSELQNKKQKILTEFKREGSKINAELEGSGSKIKTELEETGSKIHAEIATATSEALETINANDVCNRLQSTEKALEQLTSEVQQLKKNSYSQQAENGDRMQRYSIYSRDNKTHQIDDRTYTQMKSELKLDLMKFYRQQHASVQLSPLIEEEDLPLLDFYVKPEINLVELKRTLGGGKEEKTAVKKLSSVFYQDAENKYPYKEIVITADPGLGKTSFSKWLALTWCNANDRFQNDAHCYAEDEFDAMSRFDFVFLVLLRNSKEECQIDEMIWNQLLLQLETKYKQSDLERVFNEERCLVILDGLDEWTHPESNCELNAKSIPHRNSIGESTVLITTRPWKLSVTSIKDIRIDKKFEIAGLGEDSANKLKRSVITYITGEDESKVDPKVKTFNSKLNANKISDLAVIPILLMFMLCLWFDEIDLGESVSEIYTNILEMLLIKTEKILEYKELPQMPEYTQGNLPQTFREKVKCKKYFKLLMSLAQLAFETLIQETKEENQLVFNRSIANKYLNELEFKFCLKAGILTQSKDRRKLLVQNLKVSFGHKTMQEFFAALYMHSAPDKTSMPRELQVLTQCKCVSDILKMSQVLMFNSRINENMSSLISRELQRIVNEDEITREYRSSLDSCYSFKNPLKKYQDLCVSCLKEMPDKTIVSSCLQDVFIDDSCKQDQYREILQHLTSRNKHNIRSVFIGMYYMSTTGYRTLRGVIDFFSLSDLENVEKVYFWGDYNDKDILPLLNESNKCLYLSCDNSWSRSLMEKVKSLQKLEAISIWGFRMSHSVLSELYSYISQTRCLKQIKLRVLSCTDHWRDCPEIELIDLSGHSELRELTLCEIPVRELRVNMMSLKKSSLVDLSEQELVLNFVNNESTDSELTLTDVELWGVKMSARIFRDLLDEIADLPQTVSVVMADCTIEPEEEFKCMKKEIRLSQQFKVLQEDKVCFEFETKEESKY